MRQKTGRKLLGILLALALVLGLDEIDEGFDEEIIIDEATTADGEIEVTIE